MTLPIPALIAEMEAGLAQVTPGPWATETDLPYGEHPRVETADKLIAVVGNAETDMQDEWEANAAHITRCSPDNIAAIIAGYWEMEALLREALAALDEGYWSASVYHCPPKGRKPATILNAASVSIRGKFATEAEALAAAEAAIAQGRIDIGTFIHQPSAKPCAHFCVPCMAALGRLRARIKKGLPDGE